MTPGMKESVILKPTATVTRRAWCVLDLALGDLFAENAPNKAALFLR